MRVGAHPIVSRQSLSLGAAAIAVETWKLFIPGCRTIIV
jgi:hypothetical protein